MKHKKLELIREGDNPLIRITYEEEVRCGFLGLRSKVNQTVRDVVKDYILKSEGRYVYCDSGEIVTEGKDVILRFYQSKEKEYIVNGT